MKQFALSLCVLMSLPSFAVVEFIDCPPTNEDDESVVLKSREGKCIKLSIAAARQSETFKDLIEDSGNQLPIPLKDIDSQTLWDVATLLDGIHDKGDDQARAFIINGLNNLDEKNPARLAKLILAINYLNAERILPVALDMLASKILVKDIDKLSVRNADGYALYKQAFLTALPRDVQRLMIQRSVLSSPVRFATFKGHDQNLEFAMFSPDGAYIFTASFEGMAKLWNANAKGDDAKALATFRHKDSISSVAFSPDSTRFLTGSVDSTAKLWGTKSRGDARPIFTWGHADLVESVAFSPNGTRVLTACQDDAARLFDVNEPGTQPIILKHRDIVSSVVFSPNGTFVLTGSNGRARLWDANVRVNNETPLSTFLHGDRFKSAIFSPDGTRILTGVGSRTTKLWDANARGEGAQPIATFKHDKDVLSFAFSPDGTLILAGSDDATAKLWDANARGDDVKPLATFTHGSGYRAGVSSVAFSPDGTRILTGSRDTTAKMWHVDARGDDVKPLATFMHPEAQVFTVAFSPDGTRILTGSNDNKATLWSLLEASKLTNPLTEAQIIAYVQKNKIEKEKLAPHLQRELSDYAKKFLWVSEGAESPQKKKKGWWPL